MSEGIFFDWDFGNSDGEFEGFDTENIVPLLFWI